MIKTIAYNNVLSVTFFGVLFFILVRNALKRKVGYFRLRKRNKRKSDNFN